MNISKEYCMSSFLTFRYVANSQYAWRENLAPRIIEFPSEEEKIACDRAEEIGALIKKQMENLDYSHVALLLSGGIDSGILASYIPEGTAAYTVSNASVKSKIEVERAKRICERQKLKHKIIEITWEDYRNCIDELMLHDNCPVFANEPQVYVLAKHIKEDGYDTIVFGDFADIAFGGMDLMLSKDWTFDEWVDRYTFVNPNEVLVNPASVMDVYERYRTGENTVDYMKFISEVFAASSSGAYINAFECLGINYYDPYALMKMKSPLDLNRVRSGESKYLLRELYKIRFPEYEVPEKIAMARGVDTWLADWEGPRRKEFKQNCISGMTGEQKFLVYSLERFLDLNDL